MATAKRDMYLDLDALVSDPHVVKLAGKEFDISQLPLGFMVKAAKMKARLAASQDDMEEQIDATVQLVSDLFSVSDKSVTPEWVIENISIQQMVALIEFIGNTLNDAVGEDGPGETMGSQAESSS